MNREKMHEKAVHLISYPHFRKKKIWDPKHQLLGSMLFFFGDVDHFVGYFQYSTNFPVSRYMKNYHFFNRLPSEEFP